MLKLIVSPWVDSLTKREAKKLLPLCQVALFVMVGGGIGGESYACSPIDAYCDARLGQRRYKHREIETARLHLVAIAQRAGLDPNDLPKMNLPNLGVF
jgi:hypothetical protein